MIPKRVAASSLLIFTVLLACLVCSTRSFAKNSDPKVKPVVFYAEVEGTVGISMENYISKVLTEAQIQKGEMVLFQLDTPGGLVSSMRGITSAILDSPVPVTVWVAPRGARAASAGAFIVQAASVAAMSDGTNIGAAHPVQASGGDVPAEEMNKKITNDLAAQMRSLTEIHGRNGEVCSKMVTESISLTSAEALSQDVIDVIESDIDTLIANLDKRTVIAGGEEVTLELSDYEIQKMEMTTRERILHFISSPSVAYILLMIGIYAILFEVLSPGGFVMGVAGAVMVLLGAYGMRMLPLNWAGIILLVAGISVMMLDLFVGGIGILSLFGMAALIVGSLIVFRAPGGELLNVSMDVILGVAVGVSLFFILILGVTVRSLRKSALSGPEGLIGSDGRVMEDLDPSGLVSCHGEIWKAVSAHGDNVKKDSLVRVLRSDGLTLYVEPVDSTGENNHKEVDVT